LGIKTKALILVIIFSPIYFFAQKIDNMASFRAINSAKYFRFNYDNDYFTATDKNYTQGYSFELVAPKISSNPINYLFYQSKNSQRQYGIALEHIGFTPKALSRSEIQYGDRPFASAIMLKSFVIATDTIHKSRFVSSLNIGLIGPGAFGKEMQVGIHSATGNVIPQGWHNQIKNDLVLNYEINYEKQLVRFHNVFSLQSNSNMRLGTLFTDASAGINFTLGAINNPFIAIKNNKLQVYIFAQPLINVIGYDATLQGGLFNDESPYIIPSEDIKRLTYQINYGIVVQTKKMFFEYVRSNTTKRFITGASPKWGGIKLGIKF
jgi:lipid A 3-O-deacylase